MTLQQSYEIVIFDNDKEKDIKYLSNSPKIEVAKRTHK